jgi:hypothetical protein
MLHWETMLIDPNTNEPATGDATIIDRLDRIAFSYWQSGGDTTGWTDKWSLVAAPALIRLHLVFEKGDPRHWPDMVVAPVIAEGGG